MASLSNSTARRNERFRRILANPSDAFHPCDFCNSRGRRCILIADLSSMTCAECTRRGKACVSSTWDQLDRADDDLSEKIEADQKEMDEATRQALRLFRRMDELQHRLERNKKVRSANNKKLSAKIECVSREAQLSTGDDQLDPVLLNEQFDLAGVSSPFSWSGDDRLMSELLGQAVATPTTGPEAASL